MKLRIAILLACFALVGCPSKTKKHDGHDHSKTHHEGDGHDHDKTKKTKKPRRRTRRTTGTSLTRGHPPTKWARVSGTLSLVLVLGLGCASDPPKQEDMERGRPIAPSLREKIIPDQSTLEDVERLLGEPQRKVSHSDGREQWVYAWGSATSGDGGAKLQVETLSVVFEAGIVSRVDHQESKPSE